MAPMTQAELWVGRNTPDPLRGMWLEQWIGKVERALEGLRKAKQEQAAPRRKKLEQVLSGLQDMKKEWDTWQ